MVLNGEILTGVDAVVEVVKTTFLQNRDFQPWHLTFGLGHLLYLGAVQCIAGVEHPSCDHENTSRHWHVSPGGDIAL